MEHGLKPPRTYDILKEGDETILRTQCVGCPFSSSIENDPECMAEHIDWILQERDVDRIILAENYEYDYTPEQTHMLVEIASLIDMLLREENILAKNKLVTQGFDRYYPQRFAFVQNLLTGETRRHPAMAYKHLLEEIAKVQEVQKQTQYPQIKQDLQVYIDQCLNVMRKYMENTTIIKNAMTNLEAITPDSRAIYENLLTPEIRPNFTLTRFMMRPPANGELLDQYVIGKDINVEIYKIPGETENFYHIIPPEFKLSEAEYRALTLARKVMVGYKPTTTEFTERTRQYFDRVGEDLILTVSEEQGMKLPYETVKKLSTILTRYTTGLGIIEVILSDTLVQDIYINAPVGELPIRLLHADWEECSTNIIPTKEDAKSMAARFRLESGRPLDEAEPVLDTSVQVPGGRARVCVITKNLSAKGLAFAFRRHRDRPWTFPLFIENKTMSALSAGLIWFIIDGGRVLLFAGPRSSGKTSILSAALVEIMRKYRIITIEDTLELPVDEYRKMGFNVLPLKVQSAISRLESELSAEEGIRTALRLGDSCLIVGEVRSKEAHALYEAMRVGALSNVVAGTIHGDDPYGVWDRVVNDLGVPTTSFKATDFLVMPAPIRSADGLHRYRRIVTITEVGKNWTVDPIKENGFLELMKYDAKKDLLEPTKAFLDGDSEVLMKIASRVKEWSGNWEAVYENIMLRSDIKQAIVDYSKKSNNPELMEANFVAEANNMFHIYSEKVIQELGAMDSKEIFRRWDSWMKENAKRLAPKLK